MLATYAVAALLSVASVLIGQAILRACGWREWAGYSGAVGLAALMALTSLAGELPGHGTTAAVAMAAVALGSAAWLRRDLRLPPRDLLLALAVVVVLTSIPYLVNARFGVLGVSYNNDAAAHLTWTQWVQSGGEVGAQPVAGYPLGPHALAGAAARATGSGVGAGLMGLLMAVPVLTLLAAQSVLDRLASARREAGAVLVALCYLPAAYYAQAAFKETIQALLLIGFVGLARHIASRPLGRRSMVPVALLVAGSIYNYNYPGLAWFGAAVATWTALELVARRSSLSRAGLAAAARSQLSDARRFVVPALILLAAVALLIAPEASRIPDLFRQLGTSAAGTGTIKTTNIGALAGPVSSFEAFGLWPRTDFRYSPAPGIKHVAGALGLLAVVWGAWWCVRRGELVAVATAAGAAALYLVVEARESVYVAAKALAVLAPLLMVLSVSGLFATHTGRRARPMGVAAVLFAALALYSSYLALSGALVGAHDGPRQLRKLNERVGDQRLLALTLNDFAAYELPETALTTLNLIALRPQKRFAVGHALDFDLVTSTELNRHRYFITTRSRFASTPPPGLEPAAGTRSFTLWRRTGRVPERATLAEDQHPGALLRCDSPEGRRLSRRRGWAVVIRKPIFHVVPAEDRFLLTGETARVSVPLPPGRWELSLQYASSQRVDIRGAGVRTALPANMDRVGGMYSFGRVRTRAQGRASFSVRPRDPYPLRDTGQVATVLALAAVNLDAEPRVVPLRSACGRYVDWYTLGPRRPAL